MEIIHEIIKEPVSGGSFKFLGCWFMVAMILHVPTKLIIFLINRPLRHYNINKPESSKLKYEIKALKSKIRELEAKLSNRGKTMYYWLKPDESISNLWV